MAVDGFLIQPMQKQTLPSLPVSQGVGTGTESETTNILVGAPIRQSSYDSKNLTMLNMH